MQKCCKCRQHGCCEGECVRCELRVCRLKDMNLRWKSRPNRRLTVREITLRAARASAILLEAGLA